jgi:2-polyprenyl-3-methyl-5-hydroxy-6-metoxy-1,4-benzoquinol methylase
MTAVKCAVCGSTERAPAQLTAEQEAARNNVPDAIPYEVCARCGFWAQLPPPDFRYESDKDKNQRKKTVMEEAGSYKVLANYLSSTYNPKSVLDIGSSYPLLLSFLRKAGVPSVMGLDGCDFAVDYGKELDVPVVEGNFLEHDFGPRQFDMICMVHVIEHFSAPMGAVFRMKSLLKAGGAIFIRTPLNDTEGLTRWHLTEAHLQVHPVVFGRRSLKMLFELVGLECISESIANGIGHGDYVFRARR